VQITTVGSRGVALVNFDLTKVAREGDGRAFSPQQPDPVRDGARPQRLEDRGLSSAGVFPVKQLFWIGLVVIVLGLISLVLPIPHSEREGFSAGGMSMGIHNQNSETVSPIISAVMILGGAGMVITGKSRK
jgi:hypothetical protein